MIRPNLGTRFTAQAQALNGGGKINANLQIRQPQQPEVKPCAQYPTYGGLANDGVPGDFHLSIGATYDGAGNKHLSYFIQFKDVNGDIQSSVLTADEYAKLQGHQGSYWG